MSRNRAGLAKYRRGVKRSNNISYTPLIANNLLIHFDANDYASYSGYKYAHPKWLNVGTGGIMYSADISGNIKPVIDEGWKIKSFRFFSYPLITSTIYTIYNYMQFPFPNSMSGDFTYCAWINTFKRVGDNLANPSIMYIISAKTNNLNSYFGVGVDNNNKLSYLDSSPTGNNIKLHSTQSINNANWTFVAVTRSAITGQVMLYINGRIDITGTCNVGALNATDYMLIGSDTYFSGYTFGGHIGAILGYASILSADDILRNFESARRVYRI